MLRRSAGACRPVERLARLAGYELCDAPHCREGHWYQVGGRVVILVPTWITGRAYREASIARQLMLHAVGAVGEERLGVGLAHLRDEVARRGGLVALLAAALWLAS